MLPKTSALLISWVTGDDLRTSEAYRSDLYYADRGQKALLAPSLDLVIH